MYVWSGGSPEYVATVDPGDTTGIPALTSWTSQAVGRNGETTVGPGGASSRTTPDGSVIVLGFPAQLTSYDNAGHVSSLPTNCPKGSFYGKAKAWTPLLDKPLAGPVYLRSSDNPLPTW